MQKQNFPIPCVGALIFNNENKILLVKSHKWHDKFVIPGGKVHVGEKLIEALKREIKEETDLDIFEIKFIGFQEFIFDKAFWEKKHFLFFDYSCKTNSDKVKLDEEASEYIWVAPKEALNMNVEPYTKKTIKGYKKKK